MATTLLTRTDRPGAPGRPDGLDPRAAPPSPGRPAGTGGGTGPGGGEEPDGLPLAVAVALIVLAATVLTYLGMLTQIWANLSGAQLPGA